MILLIFGIIVAGLILYILSLKRKTKLNPSDLQNLSREIVVNPVRPKKKVTFQENIENEDTILQKMSDYPQTSNDDPEMLPYKDIEAWNSPPGKYAFVGGGPILGKPIGVAVPKNTIRNPPVFIETPPLGEYNYFQEPPYNGRSFPNSPLTLIPTNKGIIMAQTSQIGTPNLPFIENAEMMGFRGVPSAWKKSGVLTCDDEILNLYSRYLDTNYYQYKAEDKYGFVVNLDQSYHDLDTGDSVQNLVGKPGKIWNVSIWDDSYILV